MKHGRIYTNFETVPLLKVCYGVAMDLEEKWKKPLRDWEMIYAQLIILFEGRLCGVVEFTTNF